MAKSLFAPKATHKITGEISTALAFKLLALLVLFFSFFGPENRPEITPQTMNEKILGEKSGP